MRAIFLTDGNIKERLRSGEYPTNIDEITDSGWGKLYIPEGSPERVFLPEYALISDFVQGGGGYGDPLDRDPALVQRDVIIGATSPEAARRIYGVVLNTKTFSVDAAKTEVRRSEIRQTRLSGVKQSSAHQPRGSENRTWTRVLKIHEYLEIARDGDLVIRCARCGYLFCSPEENYKKFCLKMVVPLAEVALRPFPTGAVYLGHYHKYICPGCATLFQVDVFCPALGGEEDFWDTRINLAKDI